MNCRGCGAVLSITFLNLGNSPIANDLISYEGLNIPEVYYPLSVKTCSKCLLVQLPEVTPKELIFRSDYLYFSSYSSTWLEHSRIYAEKMISQLKLSKNDLVVEVASNDGYLLQYFVKSNIQVLGIEPASGVANEAISKGIRTSINFFGKELAIKLSESNKPKLIIANNVLAHVPNLHDFINGFSILIADEGLITFEFPHLLNLIKNNQFDTIYHEHYSYLTVTALLPILEKHKLKIIDVEKLTTHGGSLRIYVAKIISKWSIKKSVADLVAEEVEYDPSNESVLKLLHNKTLITKINLISELIACKKAGVRVAAYGAAAKGNTLLNYSKIDSDLIEYVVDLNPHKQGKFLPGSRIPVVSVDFLNVNPPDVLLVLPWNLAKEVKEQLTYQINKGLKILRAIPKLEYF